MDINVSALKYFRVKNGTMSAARRNKTLEGCWARRIYQKLNLKFLSFRKLSIRCTQTITSGLLQQRHSINEVRHGSGCCSRGLANLSCLSVYHGASLRGDRVEQRHGDSLSGLLESCYQVPDVTEKPFLHAGTGLKDEDRGSTNQFHQYHHLTLSLLEAALLLFGLNGPLCVFGFHSHSLPICLPDQHLSSYNKTH